MKNDRQRRILEIVEREAIDTQEQLQQKLQEQGVTCTQATISRDIKQLHLIRLVPGTADAHLVALPQGEGLAAVHREVDLLPVQLRRGHGHRSRCGKYKGFGED